MLLRIDAVRALASLGLERLDAVAGLLHRPCHKSPDRVPLPAHLVHDLGQRCSIFALEHRDYLGRLAALAQRARFRFSWFRSLSGFGRLLSRGGLLTRLPLSGRALGALCATLGLPLGLGLDLLLCVGLGAFAQPLDAWPDLPGGPLSLRQPALGWDRNERARNPTFGE
jgi:hypothetical protein